MLKAIRKYSKKSKIKNKSSMIKRQARIYKNYKRSFQIKPQKL